MQVANGKIIAGDLTINGLTFTETENIWTVAGNKTLYCKKTTAGAEILEEIMSGLFKELKVIYHGNEKELRTKVITVRTSIIT